MKLSNPSTPAKNARPVWYMETYNEFATLVIVNLYFRRKTLNCMMGYTQFSVKKYKTTKMTTWFSSKSLLGEGAVLFHYLIN